MKDSIKNFIQRQIDNGYLTKYRGLVLGDVVSKKHPYKPHTVVAFPACTTRSGHFVYAIADDGSELRELTNNLNKISNEMATQNSKFNEIMLDLACKSKRERDWWITLNLSGPFNRDTRQLFVGFLTGKKRPKAECGITRICELVDENLERFGTIVEDEEEE